MVSLGKGGEKTMGANVFLAGGYKEEVIDSYGGEKQERRLVICVQIYV